MVHHTTVLKSVLSGLLLLTQTHCEIQVFHFLQVSSASGYTGLDGQVLSAALLGRTTEVQIIIANTLQQGRLK